MFCELRQFMDKYDLIPITVENYPDIETVYASNQDFFLLTEGQHYTKPGIVESITAVPEGFSLNDKIFVGIWRDGEAIAVLDILSGYPAAGCIWIGLLLVHGGIQGKSVGTIISTAIFSAAKSARYTEVKLGVIDTNVKGIAFWKKMGFVQVGVSSTTIGGRQCKVFIFSHVI